MSTVVLALVCCLLVYPVASQPQGNGLRVPVQSSPSETCGNNDDLISSIEELLMPYLGPPPLLTPEGITTDLHPCGPGMRQVAYINMTDPATNCPPGFELTSNVSRRVCGKSSPFIRFPQNSTAGGSCHGTTFSTGGTPYSRVCGRIRAYLSGSGASFGINFRTIDSQYVNGYSLTHGSPDSREHIWSFSVGSDFRNARFNHPLTCPCVPGSTRPPPSFVGNDYFCDSVEYNNSNYLFFPDNPLWDGQGCPAAPHPYACACERLNPPWFTKTLPTSTTDDIEMRHCCSSQTGSRGLPDVFCSTPFEIVEIYVY